MRYGLPSVMTWRTMSGLLAGQHAGVDAAEALADQRDRSAVLAVELLEPARMPLTARRVGPMLRPCCQAWTQ